MRLNISISLLALALTANAQRFVRFIATDGKEYTGDAILPQGDTDASHSKQAKVITGDILGEFKITNEIRTIKKLLSPLPPERTHTVRCVGFNFAPHAEEANVTIPDFPILFYKPWTSLADPNGNVPVSAGYQNQTTNGTFFVSSMDYESELVVIIGKKAYNITPDVALDYVLGYSGWSGYDVSHRGWQIERGGQPQPQYSMGKDADGWGPWGPAIVSKSLIPDPQNLTIWTKVNGVTMQNDTSASMIFGVAELVSFFSMGITLHPADIIFTGTPAGVQLGKPNPVWLQNGDVVETGTEGLGTCTNTITYV
ncbi:Fumarylacetoacetate hydrolase domain-containing protein 2 [Mycena kentingensis (nom. inval.)]|nr:Fumarylacetoacetate hydrolase domain-containing protein 2 [Mycena kentingensis (nom. inval.)]